MFCRAVPETTAGIRRLTGVALAARNDCQQLGDRQMVTRNELSFARPSATPKMAFPEAGKESISKRAKRHLARAISWEGG